MTGPPGGGRQEKANELRRRLTLGVPGIDPNHRLAGRPVTYRVLDGTMLEITYKDVPGIADAEISAVKRLLGVASSCSVSPQTAETVTVRFVVELK